MNTMKVLLVLVLMIVAVVLLAGFVTGFRDVAQNGTDGITVSLADEPIFSFDWPIQ